MMGGTVDIRDGVFWLAQNWVHDAILTKLADRLTAEDIVLAGVLRAGLKERGGYCDLRHLEKSSFRRLIGATNAVYTSDIRDGSNAFNEPSFFAGYMWQFSDLRLMLRSDERSDEPREQTSMIEVSEGNAWHVQVWGYDRTIEQIAVKLRGTSVDLSDQLLATCEPRANKRLDVSRLELKSYCEMKQAVTFLQTYMSQKRITPVADPVYEIIDSGYERLYSLLLRDIRASQCIESEVTSS